MLARSSVHVSKVRSITNFVTVCLLVSTLVQQMPLYLKAALHFTRLKASIYFKISGFFGEICQGVSNI